MNAPDPDPDDTRDDKPSWRRRIVAARTRRSPAERSRIDAELVRAFAALSHDLVDSSRTAPTLAAYVPVGSEPGSTAALDAARGTGCRVIVPVTRGPGPLWWAGYDGAESLAPAPFGLREPVGEPMPPHTLATAALVLVPALAVDRAGTRLGRGAGFYDRSLHLVGPATTVAAVVFDDEVVDWLPAEPHDRRVTHVLTPTGGLRRLGGAPGPVT